MWDNSPQDRAAEWSATIIAWATAIAKIMRPLFLQWFFNYNFSYLDWLIRWSFSSFKIIDQIFRNFQALSLGISYVLWTEPKKVNTKMPMVSLWCFSNFPLRLGLNWNINRFFICALILNLDRDTWTVKSGRSSPVL